MKFMECIQNFCGGNSSEDPADDGKKILIWIFKLSELESSIALTGIFKIKNKMSRRRLKEGKTRRRMKGESEGGRGEDGEVGREENAGNVHECRGQREKRGRRESRKSGRRRNGGRI
jgi:hypothetical protein